MREKNGSKTSGWGRLEMLWIKIRDGEAHEFPLRLRLYAATELIDLLRTCGFREVEVYGTLAGDSYDHRAKRLIAVARK